MTTTEEKLSAISDFIGERIEEMDAENRKAIEAINTFGISEVEFRNASDRMLVASFAKTYLQNVAEVARKGEISQVENYIRYHFYTISDKVKIDGEEEMTKAQIRVARIFLDIIENHLN